MTVLPKILKDGKNDINKFYVLFVLLTNFTCSQIFDFVCVCS